MLQTTKFHRNSGWKELLTPLKKQELCEKHE
jgi:hypothetical protein